MTVLRFEQVGGPLRFRVSPGRTLTLGRAPQCEIVVADPSVSRRHAELEGHDGEATLRDLGSANGTMVNGVRASESAVHAEDLVTFGAVTFRVTTEETAALADELPSGIAIRALTVPVTEGHARERRALERLLDLAAGLTSEGALEPRLDGIVDLAFEFVDADRVALLLVSPPDGALAPAGGRSRIGDTVPRVPRAIAERAVAERAAVVTESAMDDARFQSGSVKLQQVRSALCVPLLAPDGAVVGVLYADTITRPVPFGDDEARALHAFAGLAATAITRARFVEEARKARDIRASFERFFAPSVAAAIAATPGQAALGGQQLPVAVLFGDIRGFTPLAEQASPDQVAALLGDYFAAMVDAVFEHHGTLDKFTGDGVMAVWGAPFPLEDAADRALAAARAMRAELARYNQRRLAAGQAPIEAGFGLSYGDVFAGNIGSERRLEYTVVGDAVNLAARLCEMAERGEILVDEDLATRLTDRSGLEPLAAVTIRGRSGTVRAFRVVEDGRRG
ncbi:MAG TPA: adenylate/guanylate cyclase domain-containing protein [Gemmatimonadales bacterium]